MHFEQLFFAVVWPQILMEERKEEEEEALFLQPQALLLFVHF